MPNPDSESFDSDDLKPTVMAGDGAMAKDSTRGSQVPARIGRYQIVEQLGRGGFGFVYKAEDSTLQRKVAIKVPRWDRDLSPEGLGRFLYEGQMLAQVNHPGIVSVYDYGVSDDGIPFVVMQFVEGQSLQTLLKAGPVEQSRALEYLVGIGEALQAAHRNLLTHRDLKPANVIVNDQHQVYLVDFGLALHEELTPEESSGPETPGTPVFMAPEQIRGENHLIDGRTDIWAFGVTMYRLLAGRLPFVGKTSKELSRAICYRQPRPLRQLDETVPKELERICLRCLQKLMDDRYQSMQDLLEELRQFQADQARTSTTDGISLLTSPTAQALQSLPATVEHVPAPGDGSSRGSPSAPGSRPSGTAPGSVEPISFVPKGLRSFDQNDAGFFLGLLPGPVDRLGVPESIRFWTARLDADHQVEAVPVGLVYGPSGCGKSSFVRAGLIPRLSGRVIPVYVDCTTDDLPALIVERVRREIDGIPEETGLVELLRQVRLGQHLNRGDKLLLVLDQFEQWLSRTEHYAEQELTEALRQCSADRLQTLLLIRDEFWLSASQFLRCLQRRIEEGHNAMALPLLDERHARRVLEAYGRVFGCLPAGDQPLASSQERFVKEAVSSLARRGRVICVHLSVFAETCRNRPWTPGEWKHVGGWEGIGREYVAGIFNDPETPGYISRHSADAWKLLACLLPQPGSDLKGQALTRAALRQASAVGPASHFDQLFEFLITHAQLVSPLESSLPEEELEPIPKPTWSLSGTEPADEPARFTEKTHAHPLPVIGDRKTGGEGANAAGREILYGLTHDFLVAPIRAWGMAKQNETREGRAATLFIDLASQWKLTGDPRFLPSLPDFVRISRLTPRSMREAESRFWAAARRKTLWTASLLGAAGLLLVLTAALLFRWQHQNRTRLLVAEYLSCPAGYVERFWGRVIERRGETGRLLEAGLASDALLNRVRAAAALVVRRPGHEQALNLWLHSVADVPGDEFASYYAAADSDRDRLLPALFAEWERRDQVEEKDYIALARLGLLLAWLGDLRALVANTRLQPDPGCRTVTMLQLADWRHSVDLLTNSIEGKDGPELGPVIYTIACALSRVSPSELTPRELDACTIWLKEVGSRHLHGGAHHAALFTLRKWDIPFSPPTQAPPGADWKSVSFACPGAPGSMLTFEFVRIGGNPAIRPATKEPEDSGQASVAAADQAFWLAIDEVSIRDYMLFLQATRAKLPDPLIAEELNTRQMYLSRNEPFLPMAWIDRNWAGKYCDWLNENGGSGLQKGTPRISSAPVDGQAMGGVQLPTKAQFDKANRGQSTTAYWFGEDLAWLGEFVDLRRTDSSPAPVRCCMPNVFGVYDLNGNVQEWLADTDPTGMIGVVKGAGIGSATKHYHTAWSLDYPIDHCSKSIGFRLRLDD